MTDRPKVAPEHRVSLASLCNAYRAWLCAQTEVEVASGCARVLGIPSDLSQYFADLTAGWSSADKQNLLLGRIKRMKWPLLDPLPLSAEEERASASFEWPPLAGWTPGMLTLGERRLRGDFKLDRRTLQSRVKAALEAALGPGQSSDGLHFSTTVEQRQLVTMVDFGTKGGKQLRYWHDLRDFVVVAGERQPTIVEQVTFANILGVYSTTWTALEESNLDAAVAHLAALCGTFVRELPGILEIARRADEIQRCRV